MEPAFDAYPALLHCGICREAINSRAQPLSPAEAELLEATPPPDLEAFHDPDHLISFARHLAGLIESPVRKVEASGHTFFAILGVVVFYRRPDGTFATAMWERPSDKGGNWLVGFLPWDTPILDFPRTTLWQSHISQGLIYEAQARIGNDCAAERWAAWVWQLLKGRLIDSIDLRRLRSRIRYGLELDLTTLSLMRRNDRESGDGGKHSVLSYNSYRSDTATLSELRKCSEFAPLLARWLTLPRVTSAGSLEVTARLKDACLFVGLKPKQWKLVVASSSPLLRAFRIFMREFVGDYHREPGEDFLGLIKLLKPTKQLDDEVWRSFLSLFGTRVNSPESFSQSLTPFGDTLCHILRLIEAGKAPGDRKQRNKELHEICAWVVDTRVHQLKPQQRKLGWAYLLKQAQLHTKQRRRSEALKTLRWTTALQPMTFGQWTVTPLTCGADLWDESVAMRHCADLYGERCMSGNTLITSVRNSEGKRKATLAFNRNEGEWHLAHAVGPANRQVGKQFDGLIDVILAELNGVEISLLPQPSRPMYRVDILDNFNFGVVWSGSTYATSQGALSAARLICKCGLPTRDASGRESWMHFGETPQIVSLGEAEPIEFCATEYINKLCGLTQHERSHHE